MSIGMVKQEPGNLLQQRRNNDADSFENPAKQPDVIKVLEVIVNFNVGGAEVLLRDLCKAWQKSRIAVTVYVLTPSDGWIEEEVKATGAQIVQSGIASRYSPRQVSRLVRHLSLTKYDLIHVHLFPAQLWVRIAVILLKLRTPLVTTEHNTWNRRRLTFFRPLDQIMYAGYRTVVCISEATEAKLREWLGPNCGKTCVIPNGIDASRFMDLTNTVPNVHAPGQKVLICVGSLSERKNHAVLIRALVQIPGCDLMLVGEGPMRKLLEKLARDLGVDERVHFLGQRSDVPALLSAADLYIQPSSVDGFCLAVVEAMSVGLPVIASNVPGMREVVADGGTLFDPKNPQELAERVNEILNESSLHRRLADSAKRRAASFGIEATATRYESLYRMLCNRCAPRASGPEPKIL